MSTKKPLPTALKIVRGNPGRRPLNDAEPEFVLPETPPEAPAWLTAVQKEFWDDLAPMLHAAKCLTEADELALATLCVACGELKHANEQIQITRLMKTPSGYVQQSPFVGMLNSAIKQIRSLVGEFGMTPSSRSRIAIKAGMKPEEDFEGFMNRAPKKKTA